MFLKFLGYVSRLNGPGSESPAISPGCPLYRIGCLPDALWFSVRLTLWCVPIQEGKSSEAEMQAALHRAQTAEDQLEAIRCSMARTIPDTSVVMIHAIHLSFCQSFQCPALNGSVESSSDSHLRDRGVEAQIP